MLDPSDAPTMRSRARVGHVLRDKWKLESLLGVGGMAAVYAATHTNNGRRGAIKLLHPELSMNPEVRSRFLREGYAANKVDHPGSVAVLDDDVAEDGSVFLVMELLDGESLESRRERTNVVPPAEVLPIIEKILDVLAAAHSKGIVHRDLKPDNIFLCRAGAVKVLDFGIARVREASGAPQHTMTNAGPMGTPAFMPPEQARGRWSEVGPRTDIWAVGATMYTLLTGRLVHEAETVNELLLAAMTKPAPRLASVLPGVSPAIAGIVDRALAFAPADRWADAKTMQSAITLVLQGFAVDARGAVDMAEAFTVKMTDEPLPNLAPANYAPAFPPPPFAPPPFAPPPRASLPSASGLIASNPMGPMPGAPFPRPSHPMIPLTPAGSLATGYPVTIGSERAAPRAGASPAGRGNAGLIFAGLAATALLGGAALWAASRHNNPPVSADQPLSGPATATPIVEAPPSAAPAVNAADPSARPTAPLAPSASASAAKATVTTPVVPLKPKPKSAQELLNRRR